MGARNDKEPRVRIYREWFEMIEPLHEKEPQKWLRFHNAALDYVYNRAIPDFADDSELAALWERTNARPFDASINKPGWIKVWKLRRKDR